MRSNEAKDILWRLLLALMMALPCSYASLSAEHHEISSSVVDEKIIINDEIAEFIIDAYTAHEQHLNESNKQLFKDILMQLEERSYEVYLTQLVDLFPVLVDYFVITYAPTRVLPKQLTCVLPFLNLLQSRFENCCNALSIDFDVLFNDLSITQSTLDTCCTDLSQDFELTFSLIQNSSMSFTIVVDFSDQFITTWTLIEDISNTLTACCQTIEQNFITTQTLLVDIQNTITTCCSVITQEINETFTVLEEFSNTFTLCCDETQQELIVTLTFVQEGANATFTIVASLESTLTQCCAASSASFDGTFTVENSGFNDTYTVINDILNTIILCCGQADEVCNTITTIEAGFNGTYTVIADLKNSLTICCDQVAVNFAQTFTILNQNFVNTQTVLADVQAAFCNQRQITQADFGPGGTTSFTITASGVYRFVEDIVFNPAGASQAIIINASNVTLDLGCFSLSQGNATGSVDAIRVNSNLNDIKIMGGLVTNFSGAGLSIQSNSTRINVVSVDFVSCALRAIDLVGAVAPNLIEDVNIIGCSAILCSQDVSGFSTVNISNALRVKIVDSSFDSNGALNHSLVVIAIVNSSECELSNLTITNNISNVTTTCILLNGVTLGLVKNCIIRANFATAVVEGIAISNSSDCLFEDIYIVNNNGSVGSGVSVGAAALLVNNCIFNRCYILGNNFIRGFEIDEDSIDNLYLNIVINANFSLGTTFFGYEMPGASGSQRGIILRNIISDNRGPSTIGMSLNGDGWYLQDNQVVRNSGTVVPQGITSVTGTHCYIRNIAFNNGTNPADQLPAVPVGSRSTPAAPATSNLTAITLPWTNMAIAV